MAGSGVTTHEVLDKLRDFDAKRFRACFPSRPINQQEMLEAAFKDGFNAAIRHLVGMGALEMFTPELRSDPYTLDEGEPNNG